MAGSESCSSSECTETIEDSKCNVSASNSRRCSNGSGGAEEEGGEETEQQAVGEREGGDANGGKRRRDSSGTEDEDAESNGSHDNEGCIKKAKRACVCDVCGATFLKPAHLQQHYVSHSSERHFTCPVLGCEESYKRRDHLNRHLKQHEKQQQQQQERGFICLEVGCGRLYLSRNNLAKHLKRHHREQLQKKKEKEEEEENAEVEKEDIDECHSGRNDLQRCGVEGNSVREESSGRDQAANADLGAERVEGTTGEEVRVVRQQEVGRSEERGAEGPSLPHACPHCQQQFSSKPLLSKHVSQHHPTLPCPMPGCLKQISRARLRRHIKEQHSNQKRSLPCPVDSCEKSYTSYSNLNCHIQSCHMRLKKFSCSFPECAMSFTLKQSRDRHEQRAHRVLAAVPTGEGKDGDLRSTLRGTGGRKRTAAKSFVEFVNDGLKKHSG